MNYTRMLSMSIMLCIVCATIAITTPQASATPSNWTYLGSSEGIGRWSDPTYIGWLNQNIANTGGQSYQYIKVVFTTSYYTGPLQYGYSQDVWADLDGFTLGGVSGSIDSTANWYMGDTSQIFIRDGWTSLEQTMVLDFGSRISGDVYCNYYPQTGYPHNHCVPFTFTVYGANEPQITCRYSGWEDNGQIAFSANGISCYAGLGYDITTTVSDGSYTINAPSTIGDMTLQYYYVNGNWHDTSPVIVTLNNQDVTIEAVYG